MTFISTPPVHGSASVVAVAAHSQNIHRNHPKDAAGAPDPTSKTKFIQQRD
jgi:hypothetical protein